MPNGGYMGEHRNPDSVWEQVKSLENRLDDKYDENRQLREELERLRARMEKLEKALADKVVGADDA